MRFSTGESVVCRALVVVAVVFGLLACNEEMTLDPEHQAGKKILPAAETQVLLWNTANRSLARVVSASQWIEQEVGGRIDLNSNRGEDDEESQVQLEFRIHEQSISSSALVSIDLDDEAVDLHFSPSGTTFDPPAELNLSADGLDLLGLDPATIMLQYFNEETGDWEPVVCEELRIELERGRIEVRNALIHHFSRYALTHN